MTPRGRRIDALPCLASFVAGALLTLPYTLVLCGLWVRAVQASVLLASLICLIAASAPWWADSLEDRGREVEADPPLADGEDYQIDASQPGEDW